MKFLSTVITTMKIKVDIAKFNEYNIKSRLYRELWIKLISADWFSTFLTYLDMNDIGRFDSAFTNHGDIPKWLHLLKNIKPNITIKNNLFIDKISNWFIQKDIHLNAVSLYYTPDTCCWGNIHR